MKIEVKNIIPKIVLIIMIVLVDLLSKTIVANHFLSGGEEIVIIEGLLSFSYIQNTGAAFGMFSNSTLALAMFSLFFVLVFIFNDFYTKKQTKLYIVAFSMIMAGAIGNLIDRLFLGFVRDFIGLKFFSFLFNIADGAISIGVVLFMLDLILVTIKERKEINKLEIKK